MVKLPRKKVTYVIPNNDMNYGKDVPADQLPKVKVQEDNVCACPYCSGRFVAEGLKENPAPQPSNSNILLTCTRCGYTWSKRKNKPKKCPKCQSYQWESKTYSFTCSSCGHSWTSTNPDGPIRCPSCRTTKWMEPNTPVEWTLKDIPSEEYITNVICREYAKGRGCSEIAKKNNLPLMKVVNTIRAVNGPSEIIRM